MKHMWSEEEIEKLIEEHGGSGGSTLEDIVDSKGNKRFIEGNGAPATITGVTFTYNKWSLSGTHLMCVLAGTLAGNTFLDSNLKFTSFALPQYILDKIVPVYGTVIDVKTVKFYTDGGTADDRSFYIKKTNGLLTFVLVSGGSLQSSRNFRIQMDLLIDSE